MCGRINQSSPQRVARALQATLFDNTITGSFNIAPTMPLLAVRSVEGGAREAVALSWGLLPRWVADPKQGARPFNARAETAATLPTFREAFRHRRCVAPIDGFYEWRRDGKKTGPRFHIHAADGAPLLVAGLWERWDREGAALETVSVLTIAANAAMAAVHDRMPVLLDAAGADRWLDPGTTRPPALADLLAPCPDEWLRIDAVSAWGNSARNDGPSCLEP